MTKMRVKCVLERVRLRLRPAYVKAAQANRVLSAKDKAAERNDQIESAS